MAYSDMPVGNGNALSIDRIVDAIFKIDSKLEIEKGLLKGMLITESTIMDKLINLEGIAYKIMFKRELENKSISRIALELNYSERQVFRIISKMSY